VPESCVQKNPFCAKVGRVVSNRTCLAIQNIDEPVGDFFLEFYKDNNAKKFANVSFQLSNNEVVVETTKENGGFGHHKTAGKLVIRLSNTSNSISVEVCVRGPNGDTLEVVSACKVYQNGYFFNSYIHQGFFKTNLTICNVSIIFSTKIIITVTFGKRKYDRQDYMPIF